MTYALTNTNPSCLHAKVAADLIQRIGKVNGKMDDLYFELNKWSFESEFSFQHKPHSCIHLCSNALKISFLLLF